MPDWVPGEVLVKFATDSEPADRESMRAQYQPEVLRLFRMGAEHWRVSPAADIADLVARLNRENIVEYAHPNYLAHDAATTPDDDYFNEQWSIYNVGQMVGDIYGVSDKDIDGELAWDITTGSSNVVVAVLETNGVDWQHPDLAANIWQNAAEVNGQTGVDDDNNGYTDDVRGWDLVNLDADPSPYDPPPPGVCANVNSHGTKVAGVLAARGNNGIGVAGIGWNVKIMVLRASGTAKFTEAVEYAADNGADVINASWQVACPPPCTLYDAIKEAGDREITFVAAAMNTASNNDTTPWYPASYDLPNIIAVAATDQADGLASFSNWGPTSVDLGAPGKNLWTTLPVFDRIGDCGGSQLNSPIYALTEGTSFATPLTAGVAALIRSLSPQIPSSLLKDRILDNVDPNIPALVGKTVTGGRLNAFRAIDAQDTVSPTAISNLSASNSTSTTVNLAWTTTGDDDSNGIVELQQVRYSTSNITSSNFNRASKATNVPAPAGSGTSQNMTATGLSKGTCYYWGMKAFDEWGNGPLSNVTKCGTRPAVCVASYCKDTAGEMFRCTWSSSYGTCGCCQFSCVPDETCTAADPTPTHACGNFCL